MKVKNQWIVEYRGLLTLLVLTENKGYLIYVNNQFEFIANVTAQKLIISINA